MSLFVTALVCLAVGVLGGGYLGYRWGASSLAKAVAAARALGGK